MTLAATGAFLRISTTGAVLRLLLCLLLALPAAAWPQGWKELRTVEADPKVLSAKLGLPLQSVQNAFLEVEGQPLQVNTILCASSQDAVKLHSRLGQPQRIFARDSTVTELVCQDAYLLQQAIYALELKARKQSYRVTFRAAGLQECAPMAWNRMFNACRTSDRKTVDELSSAFKFSRQLVLRNPKAEVEPAEPRFGFPEFTVAVNVDSEAFGLTPGTAGKTGATPFWPADDAELKTLAGEAVGSQKDKVRALLSHVHQNMRYGGVTGSRWGVKKFLQQKTGQCWDYSDLFITLCRSQGIPARQVMGWMVPGGGHVWAEVWTGSGWLAVDPTAGALAGSDLVPLFTSEDGRVPVLYTSSVNVVKR